MTAGSTACAGTGAAPSVTPGIACVPTSSSGRSAPSGRYGPREPGSFGQGEIVMRSTSRSVIRTAVFPVAGRGTRFLPATKASPKEMLPVVDKPLIQYAVEEALAADVERLVFITGSSKRAIEDHFDTDEELARQLTDSGKQGLLA